MYGWNDRPQKPESRMTVNDNPVYEIGRYQITVLPDKSVTYVDPHRHRTDPRNTFPNMDVLDGMMRIPLTDMAGLILSRLDPSDLARALWETKEVRDAFMESLVEHWGSEGFTDEDRRAFLAKIKETVHDEALDKLASNMHSLEYAVSKRSYFYHEVNRVNEELHEQGLGVRLKHEDNDPDFRIGGKHWDEARDFWRAEVKKLFGLEDKQ